MTKAEGTDEEEEEEGGEKGVRRLLFRGHDEEEEEEKEVVEIVHREKGEEKNIEVKVKEEPIIIAHNDENESGGNHPATIKKERKFKTTAGTGSEGGEREKYAWRN